MQDDQHATRGSVEEEPGWRARNARPVGGEPEWAAWRWVGGGRSISVLGVFLVLIGVGLLIQQIQPAITLTSLVLLALGMAFAAVWLLSGVRGAFVPAAFLLSLALGRLVVELGVVTGDGWTAFFLGCGLLAIWGVGKVQRVQRDWALWLGLILVLVGLAQITLRVAGLDRLGLLWPALIIVVGAILLYRSRARSVPPVA